MLASPEVGRLRTPAVWYGTGRMPVVQTGRMPVVQTGRMPVVQTGRMRLSNYGPYLAMHSSIGRIR